MGDLFKLMRGGITLPSATATRTLFANWDELEYVQSS
jgi:hypothetical protein